MSIIVGKIENKFWRNGSYKQPNNFPVYSIQKEFKDRAPSLTSFMGGNIYLEGGEGNHCIYEGGYYAMYILQVIDKKKDLYHYRLERELGFDVLAANAEVVGDLSTSNNDLLLEQNLNRTFATLDTPANLTVLNFDEKETEQAGNNFEFFESKKIIEEYLISKTAFDAFDHKAKNWDSDYGKKNIEKFYYEHRNPAVFILSYLYTTKISNGGKSKLRDKVNQFVKDVKANAAPFRISKINDLPNSELQGKFAITYKVDGIGTGTEQLKLDVIDLSELKDIRPIHNLTLQEMMPNTEISLKDNFSGGVFDIPEQREDTKKRYLGKITKKAYLPNQNDVINTPKGAYALNFQNSFNWRNVKRPQEIKGKDGGRKNSFLYYLDNLNFTVTFDKGRDGGGRIYAVSSGYSGMVWSVADAREWAKNTWAGEFPTPWVSTEFVGLNFWDRDLFADPYRDLGRDTFVKFGFLIYQIYRRQLEWRLFEYRGSVSLENVKYISGIRRNFESQYKASGKGGSDGYPFLQPDKDSLISKFYLDNYLLSWLSFMPDDGFYAFAYHYYDPLKIKKFLPSSDYYYTYDIIRADIHKPTNSSKVIDSPGKLPRITNFITEREENLENNIFLFDILEPRQKIEKGDYFFSDQEYSIEFSESSKFHQGDGKPNDRGEREGIKMAIKIEDFVKRHKDHLLDNVDRFVVLCSTLDGNFEIRSVEKYKKPQYLAKGDDQLIKEVDGKESRDTIFYHFKKLFRFQEIDKIDHSKGISDEVKNAAITALYKLHGYKVVTNERGTTSGNYFSNDVLDKGNQKIWFELVGTSWYCLLHKGKVHLVAKDDKPFSPIKVKTHKIIHPKVKVEQDDPKNPGQKIQVETKEYLNKFELIEKVNQQVRLQFHNVPYHLKGKTTFTDEDVLTLSYESSKLSGLVSEFNHYFVKLESGFDQIGWEEVPVPKVLVQSKALADDVQREALQFNLIQSRFSYELSQERFRLAERRYHENITRAQNQLDIQKQTAFWKAASDLVVHTASAHVLAKGKKVGGRVPSLIDSPIGTGRYYVETTGKEGQTLRLFEKSFVHRRIAKKDPSRRKEVMIPNYELGMKHIQIPRAASAAVGSAMNSAINIGLDMAFNGPEQQRMIDMDKQLGAEELAIQSLGMETTHMERQLQNQIALNNLSNRYSTPTVTQSNLMEEYRKRFGTEEREVDVVVELDEIDPDDPEKKRKKTKLQKEKREVALLNPIHLAVFTPSVEQLKYLKEHKEEYGIMCDIQNTSTDFFPGMPVDIVRYSRIQDEGIKNLTNPIVRGYLYNRMTVGTKIVNVEGTVIVSSDTRAQIQSKIIHLYESLKKQEATSEMEKTELNKKITELENFLLNKTTQHQEKLEEIKQLNAQIEKITKDLEDCNNDKTQKDNEIQKIKEELKNSQDSADNLQEEIKQCKINLTNIQQAKETCDRINAAEQKKLKAEIGTLKQQLAERTREKENLNDLKQDLERQLRECLDKPKEPAEVEELKKQLAEQTKRAETSESKVADLTNRLEASKPLPNECELLHNMIRVPYKIDVKQKSTGSKAEELCQYLAHQLKEIEQNEVYRHVSQYPDVKEIMDLILEFENIKAIYIFRDAMSLQAWPQYVKYKKEGIKETSQVDEVIGILSNVNDHLKNSHLHGLKALLDEIAFKMYKAKDVHSVKNKKDPDNEHRDVSDLDIDENLQFLFGSFIGGGKILYKELYGEEVEGAIKRKLFYESPCVIGGIPTIQYIDNLNKGTQYVTASIPVGNAPPEAHYLGDVWKNGPEEVERCFREGCEFEISDLSAGKAFEMVNSASQVDSSKGSYKQGCEGVIFDFGDLKSGYPRYGSNKSSSGSRYYSGMHLSPQERGLTDIGFEFDQGSRILNDGIYLHGAGQLAPEEFFKKRIENGKQIIQSFHKALSHEDLRDQIKREKKLDIKIRTFYGYPQLVREKYFLRLTKQDANIDIVKYFGTRDAYQALGILTVLSENGLYMNKVGQGNDAWKYRIQPSSHPFHETETQEVIENMTKIARKERNVTIGMDFLDGENMVIIVSNIMKGNFKHLEMPLTLSGLKQLSNTGFYRGSVSEDADPNDWDFD